MTEKLRNRHYAKDNPLRDLMGDGVDLISSGVGLAMGAVSEIAETAKARLGSLASEIDVPGRDDLESLRREIKEEMRDEMKREIRKLKADLEKKGRSKK